jgi:hypothetical protein
MTEEIKDLKRIEKGRMDIKVDDLKEDEIEIVLSIGLCFNPKTKKWDGSWTTGESIMYFVNEDGILTLPLGEVYNLDLKRTGLTSLHNFPETVTHDLNISDNKLKSLEGCPSKIGGNFSCDNNMIETLEDLSPTLQVSNFSCQNNKLKDLRGCPSVIKELNVSNNPLTSLKGMPKPINDQNQAQPSDMIITAFNTMLKNYAYLTTSTFNISSLYKISNHEHDFVSYKRVRKKKDRKDLTSPIADVDYIVSTYHNDMDEREYYLELANFMSKAELEEDAEEIWWHEDVLPNIKNLFKSMKTVTKFNL